MRHRAARRARIRHEKDAHRARQKEWARAEDAARRLRRDDFHSLRDLRSAQEWARTESHNAAHTETVRFCLGIFEQQAEAVLSDERSYTRQVPCSLTHYFMLTNTTRCLECACGYVELLDTVNDTALAKAVDSWRVHVKETQEAERLERLENARIRSVNAGCPGTRVPAATIKARKARGRRLGYG